MSTAAESTMRREIEQAIRDYCHPALNRYAEDKVVDAAIKVVVETERELLLLCKR